MKNIFRIDTSWAIILLTLFFTAACNRFSTRDYEVVDNFFSSVPPEVICTSANLTWNRNAESAKGFAGYKIYYGEQPGGTAETYETVADVGLIPFIPGSTLSLTRANYRILNLKPNTTYYFAVSAYGAGTDENGNFGIFEGKKSNEASGLIPKCGALKDAVISVK